MINTHALNFEIYEASMFHNNVTYVTLYPVKYVKENNVNSFNVL